jgi:hypothetical protein
MKSFFIKTGNRWLSLILVFIIGPMIIFFFLIRPARLRISGYEELMHTQSSGMSPLGLEQASPSEIELKQLNELRKTELARFKKIQSREALFIFSGALADALANSARSYGLRVNEVNLEKNPLINGSYVPVNDQAMEKLKALPGMDWNELKDPLDLPLFNLPSIEIQITVAAEYSQVFSFIESLADFPAAVNLTNLELVDDRTERSFRLKIRGYYCSGSVLTQGGQITTIAAN